MCVGYNRIIPNKLKLVVLICCDFLLFFQQFGFKQWGVLNMRGAFIMNAVHVCEYGK